MNILRRKKNSEDYPSCYEGYAMRRQSLQVKIGNSSFDIKRNKLYKKYIEEKGILKCLHYQRRENLQYPA